MKPRNKFERKILWIKNHLKSLNDKEKKFIYNLFPNYVFAIKKEFTCFNCAHVWSNGQNVKKLRRQGFKTTCPNCGKELIMLDNGRHMEFDREYVTKIDTYKNFQIVRIFFVRRWSIKGKKAEWHTKEVVQHWIDTETGKKTLLSVGSNAMGGWNTYGPAWNWNSMSVKKDLDKYYINLGKILPERKIHKNIRRNGFKGDFHEMNVAWFFTLLMNPKTKGETLYKAGQFNLFRLSYNYKEEIKKYWPQIKICIRNKYFIQDVSMWFDYLQLLEEFGKDIYNAKYICPANFRKEHDRYDDKKRKILEKKRIEELKKQIQKDNKEYRNRIRKFLDIKIENQDISIKVIPTVSDLKKESDVLKHCAFNNQYHKKNESILLSAKVKRKRTETVELSLKNFTILQSRGFRNNDSEYHKEIINLVNQNKKIFKKAMKNEPV